MKPAAVPESFGLIHEYYTPTAMAESIAELLCPLLPELAGNGGIVRAREPSAGIGRLVRAFNPPRCLALEVGGQMERWVRDEGPRFQGTISLVIANPPYGERGVMAREDPDPADNETRPEDSFTSELDAVLDEDD